MSDAPWWCAISNTNCERRATTGLHDAGFEVWWPTRIVRIRVGPKRKKCDREFPLFPGYLFVRSTPRGWYGMREIDGIRAVLCVDHMPLSLTHAKMLELQNDCAEVVRQDPNIGALVVGDQVVVTNGPFLGHSGLLTRFMGSRAYEVAIQAFGRSTAVKIDPNMLEKV